MTLKCFYMSTSSLYHVKNRALCFLFNIFLWRCFHFRGTCTSKFYRLIGLVLKSSILLRVYIFIGTNFVRNLGSTKNLRNPRFQQTIVLLLFTGLWSCKSQKNKCGQLMKKTDKIIWILNNCTYMNTNTNLVLTCHPKKIKNIRLSFRIIRYHKIKVLF